MKNHKMIMLSVGSALILVVAVFFSFIIFPMFVTPNEVTIPPLTATDTPGSSGSAPPGETVDLPVSESPPATPHPLSRVAIMPENVQELVASFEVPDSYTARYTATQYWQGGSGGVTSVYRVIPGYTKCETLDKNGNPHILRITGGGQYHEWRAGSSSVYTANAGQFTPYNMGILPIYDEEVTSRIADASPDNISSTSFEMRDGIPSLSLTVRQDKYTYLYVFDADNGALLRFEKNKDGTLVYSCTMDSFDPSTPDNTFFTMPNGNSAILLG